MMHPARQLLVDELTAQLEVIAPGRFKVHPYEGTLPSLDGSGKVPLIVGISRVNNARQIGPGGRSYAYDVAMPSRLTEPGRADDQLDDDLELVLDAIDAATYIDHEGAARGTWANEARPAYVITTTVYR